jgi:hypothetical protein
MTVLAQMPAPAQQLPALPEGPAFEHVRGPIEIPAYEPWQIALLIGLSLIILFLFTWLFIQRRQRNKTTTPPYEIAIAELETAAQLTTGDDERFAMLCSQALRRYLEDGCQLRSKARTSEEFLRDLKNNTRFDADFQQKLEEVLATFDSIKFAQESISAESRTRIINTVRELIDKAHHSTQREGEHQ